jgi:hypothetical protein
LVLTEEFINKLNNRQQWAAKEIFK